MLVSDLMLPLDRFPIAKGETLFKVVLELMNVKKLGIACIIDDQNRLLGVITDGDIRRQLLSVQKPMSSFFIDDCIEHSILLPTTILPSDSITKAVNLMEEKQIWDLPVTEDGILKGLLHLHPIVKALLKEKL